VLAEIDTPKSQRPHSACARRLERRPGQFQARQIGAERWQSLGLTDDRRQARTLDQHPCTYNANVAHVQAAQGERRRPVA